MRGRPRLAETARPLRRRSARGRSGPGLPGAAGCEGPGSARKSWDPLAVLVAVRGANPAWFESVPGTNSVDATGANTWVGAAGTNATNQTYLSFHAKRGAAQRAAVESTLDELLCAPPKLRPAHFIGN